MRGTVITEFGDDHLEGAGAPPAKRDRRPRLFAGATILHPTADAISDSRTGGRRECAEAVTIKVVAGVRRSKPTRRTPSVLGLTEERGRAAAYRFRL
jgi:hypothetical protein